MGEVVSSKFGTITSARITMQEIWPREPRGRWIAPLMSNWNFEKFVSVHKKQHTILANLEADGTHNGINGLTQVRLLNQGIKTKELDVPKSQIMASATLRQDFDECVSLYKDFIELNNAPMNPTFNISETKPFVKKKPNHTKYPQRQHKRGHDDDGDEEE
eukprot:scaffold139870_cov31-Attheya_sp.AAC.1